MKKVCSINAILIFALMLILPVTVLHAEDPPSTQDQAVREGQPASTAPVPPALRQALASSLGESVSVGAKAIPNPPTGSWGIVSEGDGGGGIFRDSDSEAEAWLGSAGYGVQGFGSVGGGYFKDSDSTGYAKVGWRDYGINAYGSVAGGFFSGSGNNGNAYIGHGNNGISAFGLDKGIDAYGYDMGGNFGDLDGTGYANVGYGNRGIEAYGTEMGGYFGDSDDSGYAHVGSEDFGVKAYGSTAGGYFEDITSFQDTWAYVGYGSRGIEAYGTGTGGYFKDSNDYGYAYVGYGERGIEAYGFEMGGYFGNTYYSGYAHVAELGYGIRAFGNSAGGYFKDLDASGEADVGHGDVGIEARGSVAGGKFWDTDTSDWAQVANSTYKINGTGSVNFVQNHPYDPSSVIVYAAPEGDEVATYTRGTARLVEGEATVSLGETFKWVTNPDIGLTAFLTPVGDWCDLYVAEQATDSIVVRSRDGSDCGFNFMVYGLRIGFEESSVVQEKARESYIPSMADHRQLYDRRPDLKSYNSLERFKDMRSEVHPKAKLDLSRAQALRDAIIEFDPAVHELPMHPGQEEGPADDLASEEAQRGAVQAHERVRAARGDYDRQPATDQSELGAAIPMDDEGNVYTTSFRPSSQDLASLVTVSETVEPGDVLVIDRKSEGMMRRGSESHDTGVIGVVTAEAGVVLETQPLVDSGNGTTAEESHRAAVALAGVVRCKVDAAYGAIWPGDLLVTSLTPGHAMRTDAPLPGTTLGKALEPLEEGTGTIKVLVMLR